MTSILQPIPSLQLFCLAFLSILFLQSGLDKLLNYRSNLEWLTKHFAKSPLKGTIGILLPLLTTLEVASGICCLLGIIQLVLSNTTHIGLIGTQLSALSFLALFFGQRIAQDYEGAAVIPAYFLVSVAGIYFLS